MTQVSNAIVDRLDWPAVERALQESGYALTPPLLSSEQCAALQSAYADSRQFRSHIVMSRYGFGSGNYKYFHYPLPDIVQRLRSDFYRLLAPLANGWNDMLGIAARYPPEHAEWLERCHDAEQRRPTPLLLRYEAGDYNCLHQDLYGELHFPLQIVCFLSEPKRDYEGGEFILLEQRPRMQSRAEVLLPAQGQILILASAVRPKRGSRGYYRVQMRHGVSTVRSGLRYTLGIPFHDAL